MNDINYFLRDNVKLVVVSKNRSNEEILDIYEKGVVDFGENKVQNLVDRYESLPKDIKWHMIGHLQTNKVKYIAPFVNLIQSVDSFKLLKEINEQAKKNNRVIDFLFQIKIAEENQKYGLSSEEFFEIIHAEDYAQLKNINLRGLMGMSTLTEDKQKIKNEFLYLRAIFDKISVSNNKIVYLSMGMSSDYDIAIGCGSNMIRIGSAIFE